VFLGTFLAAVLGSIRFLLPSLGSVQRRVPA